MVIMPCKMPFDYVSVIDYRFEEARQCSDLRIVAGGSGLNAAKLAQVCGRYTRCFVCVVPTFRKLQNLNSNAAFLLPFSVKLKLHLGN